MTSGPGLVGQATSVTRYPSLSPSQQLRELSRQRRFRRLRRVVLASADATRDACTAGGFRWQAVLVTLTYRAEASWSSRDISAYVRRTREHLRRRGIAARYQWVIELTRKGKPHYHLLFWLPHGQRLPKPDQSGHWTHGLSRIERARRPVGYLVKYATKGTDGELPKGARLFGTGSPDSDIRHVTHRAGLPMWLSETSDPSTRCSRVARVGWVERNTGAVHQSPFLLRFSRDDWGFVVITVIKRNES